MIKTFNDVSGLYESGLIEEDGAYRCPVCNKTYKRLTSAQKHIEKQDCFSVRDVFENTVHEAKAFVLYKNIVSVKNPRANLSLRVFRKSNLYKNCVKFIVFCNLHEVKVPDIYFMWLRDYRNIRNDNTILTAGREEANLRDFRVFQQKYNYIDSEHFFGTHKENLEEDATFFIRSIEKAHIGLQWLMEKQPDYFESVYSELPADYMIRIEQLVTKMEKV
jgi:hypothetical protein